jgi:hypothetical protein
VVRQPSVTRHEDTPCRATLSAETTRQRRGFLCRKIEGVQRSSSAMARPDGCVRLHMHDAEPGILNGLRRQVDVPST